MRRLKAKKARARGQSLKGNQRAKGHQEQSLRDLPRVRMPFLRNLSPNPNLKPDHACLMDTCLP